QWQSGRGAGPGRGGERGGAGPVAHLAAVAWAGTRGRYSSGAMAGAGRARPFLLAWPGRGGAAAGSVRQRGGTGMAGPAGGRMALAAGDRLRGRLAAAARVVAGDAGRTGSGGPGVADDGDGGV